MTTRTGSGKKAPAKATTASSTKTTSKPKAAAPTKAAATKKTAAPKKAAAPKVAAPKKAAAPKTPKVKKPAAPKVAAPKKAAAPKRASTKIDLVAAAQPAAEMAKTGAVVNHIALVVDRSGSMSSIRSKVIAVFNSQLAEIRKNSESLAQQTFVSFYTFQTTVDAPRFFAKPIADVSSLTELRCTGTTALLDATGQAIVDLSAIPGADLDNVSFLILVLTDGAENNSRKYKSSLKGMINRVQATGRWTLAFLTPPGGESTLQGFGIPAGNIRAWETSQAGIKQLGQAMQQGLQNFYQARSKGQKAVVGVFTTDLSTVSTTEVKTTLTEATGSFVTLPVASDCDIRTLVDSALGAGSFKKGNGYYELNKPELVQEYKEVAIVEKATGKIYIGDDARTLLGLPIGARIKVRPGDHAGFSVYVQSTSVNRRLAAGTTLLYRK
ncbi:MAG: VWA domain-containing protein [Myxococcales bacterium]|nr:VWA domain-containing protein [Myxococcales bacterium]